MTVTTPYALLDKFNDDASAQVADIMKEASMFRLDLFWRRRSSRSARWCSCASRCSWSRCRSCS
jgi:hypothetical protein